MVNQEDIGCIPKKKKSLEHQKNKNKIVVEVVGVVGCIGVLCYGVGGGVGGLGLILDRLCPLLRKRRLDCFLLVGCGCCCPVSIVGWVGGAGFAVVGT